MSREALPAYDEIDVETDSDFDLGPGSSRSSSGGDWNSDDWETGDVNLKVDPDAEGSNENTGGHNDGDDGVDDPGGPVEGSERVTARTIIPLPRKPPKVTRRQRMTEGKTLTKKKLWKKKLRKKRLWKKRLWKKTLPLPQSLPLLLPPIQDPDPDLELRMYLPLPLTGLSIPRRLPKRIYATKGGQ